MEDDVQIDVFTPLPPGDRLEPDVCWIIWDPTHTMYAYDGSQDEGGAMYVFTSEELAQMYIRKAGLVGSTTESYPWEELVEEFNNERDAVLVNPGLPGESGLVERIPLELNPRIDLFE
ncbi:hypothetical protein IID24_02125 [Patescibacteria group bacterium]|nr:hypothetical protein [Patescibacteria group bacterium]